MTPVVENNKRDKHKPRAQGPPAATVFEAEPQPQQQQKTAPHQRESRGERRGGTQLTGRDWPFRALGSIDLMVEGVVQQHAADIEEGEGGEQNQAVWRKRLATGERHPGKGIGPHGRQV